MKIFSKFKFLKNRITQIPRSVLKNSRDLWLSYWELDIILKLLNFSHFSEIFPNLTELSKQTWVSVRTYQRDLSSLEDKWLLSFSQRRTKEGYFSTNNYDLSWLFKKIEEIKGNNQLSIFDVFWEESNIPGGFILSPRILDFFQKELNIDRKEILVIKYLFYYIDQTWMSEISLNYISKISPLSRTSIQKAIKTLVDKSLIEVKEEFSWRWVKLRNKYFLTPLLKKLNNLEKNKVEKILKEQWKWKDFTKSRLKGEIKQKQDNKEVISNRIIFLENEILKLQSCIISKNSSSAEKIREYQLELNDIKYKPLSNNSLSNLLLERFSNIKKIKDVEKNWKSKYSKDQYRKAKNICDSLKGDWNKNSNFYLKAVSVCETTIDRYVWMTKENAKNKERYFLTCVSKVFKKQEKLLLNI